MKCFALCAVVCLATGKRATSTHETNQKTRTRSGSFFPVPSRCLDGSEYDHTDLIEGVSAFALYLPVDDAVTFDALATFAEYMDTDFSG